MRRFQAETGAAETPAPISGHVVRVRAAGHESEISGILLAVSCACYDD